MSSKAARDAILAAVTAAAAPQAVYNLSDYVSSDEVLQGLTTTAVLVQFVTADEQMISIAAENNQGYEEAGTAAIHIIEPVGVDSDAAVALSDQIRQAMRGKRLADRVVVMQFDPFTDFGGNSIGLTGGAWKGWVANLYYERDQCG